MNIILIEDNIESINKIIKIINPINDLRIKSIFYQENSNLYHELNKSDNIIFLSIEKHSILKTRINSNNKIIIYSEKITKPYTEKDLLYISSNDKYIDIVQKNIISYLNINSIEYYKRILARLFNNLNFDFKLTGTIFLYESLLICLSEPNDYLYENLNEKIYTPLAKKHETTPDNIKWSIIRSIKSTYLNSTDTQINKINTYFNLDDNQNLTPKIIICTIINKMI